MPFWHGPFLKIENYDPQARDCLVAVIAIFKVASFEILPSQPKFIRFSISPYFSSIFSKSLLTAKNALSILRSRCVPNRELSLRVSSLTPIAEYSLVLSG